MMLPKIKELFESGQLFIEDGFLTSKDLDSDEFSNLFPKENYSSAQYSKETNTGTVEASQLDFIFLDFHDLFSNIINKLSISDEIIVIDEGEHFIPLGETVNFFHGWLDFFDNVSDHSYVPASDDSKAFIFINKGGKSNSSVLELDLGRIPSSRLKELVSNIASPFLLLDSCLQEDAHQSEKLSTMKATIVSLVEDKRMQLVDFMESGEFLLNSFHINYEMYLKSFSFEDFIKDLEDDVGEFINKVEEQIQGYYVQSLAVPGAVILASALRGAEKGVSLALVFSALLALILVFRSLISKRKFINRIAENTQTKLKLYEKRTEEVSNSFARETIAKKIKIAKDSVECTRDDNVKDIEGIRDIIIGLIFMYFLSAIVFCKF